MQNEVYLSVEGLVKKYRDLTAVDNISFSVKRGEVFGLLGPNGAGKTTLIRMLCGLIKADGGSISMKGGAPVSGNKDINPMIGLCPQEIVVWELLTCLEQLSFLGISYGLTAKKARERSLYLLESLGLWEKKNKLAKTLSGGMQRRLNLALALIHNPELIILDEPQAGLDPQSRILVRDFIRALSKERTVILTTHDMDEAERLSDRVAIIDRGKILVLDTPEKIKEQSGAGDILQIRLNGVPKGMSEKIIGSVPPEFTDKKFSDGQLLLGGNDLLNLVPTIVQRLQSLKLQPENIIIRKRTLEDAFIAMTGRRLRE